jgi:hypothetical protein
MQRLTQEKIVSAMSDADEINEICKTVMQYLVGLDKTKAMSGIRVCIEILETEVPKDEEE